MLEYRSRPLGPGVRAVAATPATSGGSFFAGTGVAYEIRQGCWDLRLVVISRRGGVCAPPLGMRAHGAHAKHVSLAGRREPVPTGTALATGSL